MLAASYAQVDLPRAKLIFHQIQELGVEFSMEPWLSKFWSRPSLVPFLVSAPFYEKLVFVVALIKSFDPSTSSPFSHSSDIRGTFFAG